MLHVLDGDGVHVVVVVHYQPGIVAVPSPRMRECTIGARITRYAAITPGGVMLSDYLVHGGVVAIIDIVNTLRLPIRELRAGGKLIPSLCPAGGCAVDHYIVFRVARPEVWGWEPHSPRIIPTHDGPHEDVCIHTNRGAICVEEAGHLYVLIRPLEVLVLPPRQRAGWACAGVERPVSHRVGVPCQPGIL